MSEEKFSYDRKEDILFYNPGKKVRDSLEIGKIVLDFSFGDKIVGFEILDASDTLSDLTDLRIRKDKLESIQDAEVKVKYEKDYAFVVIVLEFEDSRQTINLSIPDSTVSPASA